MEKLFNFDYNANKHPNYRVEYYNECGSSISSPAIFKSDREGIFAALRHYLEVWKALGFNTIVVCKYTNKGLVDIYRRIVKEPAGAE